MVNQTPQIALYQKDKDVSEQAATLIIQIEISEPEPATSTGQDTIKGAYTIKEKIEGDELFILDIIEKMTDLTSSM